MSVETLRWREGRLELLDQTALPEVVRYIPCHNLADVIRAIKSMVVRGAPAIGVTAAYGVALAARSHAQEQTRQDFDLRLKHSCKELIECRPTAVNLRWAVQKMLHITHSVRGENLAQIADLLLGAALEIHQQDIETNRAIGNVGAALLPRGARVLTHCNAGALATAGYGTALGVVRAAFARDQSIQVFANETRPLLQGARLTAWELSHEGIPVTLITDSMSGYLMARGEIDVVVVGADRVAANGDVANKIGTYMVAVLAERHKIPFYVACPWSTVDLETPDGSAIEIEERADTEVTGFRGHTWAPANVEVRNPAFDVTPSKLVTALITDRGIVSPMNIVTLEAAEKLS